jgi:hypothetical protein
MKRAGRTETLSISLGPEPLAVLRRRAKQVHSGNLSAAIAEAAELIRRDMAMGELVADLEKEHGPLSNTDRAAFEEELRGKASRRRKTRAA